MTIRYYCKYCRHRGAEIDDNIILLMDGAWDVESQTWKAHGATADPYCGTCGLEEVGTEEVANLCDCGKGEYCPQFGSKFSKTEGEA